MLSSGWKGIVSSTSSTNSDGYIPVSLSSASGSASADSGYGSSWGLKSSNYRPARKWRDGHFGRTITVGDGYGSNAALTLSGSVIPTFGASGTVPRFDLGSSTYKFRTAYLGGGASQAALIASGSLVPADDDTWSLGGYGSFSNMSNSISVGSSQTVGTSTTSLTVSSLSEAAAAELVAGKKFKLSGSGNEWTAVIAATPSTGATAITFTAGTAVGSGSTDSMYATPQLASLLEWKDLRLDGIAYMDEVQLDNISEPSDVSNKLYSVSSILHWNGAPLGVPVTYRHTMTSSDISSDSRRYTMTSSDRTGDSDVVFSSSTVLNKVQVYLNGQLQFINASGDVNLTSTSLQLDFLATGALKADDIIQVIVFA